MLALEDADPLEAADALQLPAPFDMAELGAGLESGQRYVSWTLTRPTTLYRNRFFLAVIEIIEGELWRGEPLRLSADRWANKRADRAPFTAAGRDDLQRLLVPPVARYGFSRLWTRVHGEHQYLKVDDARAAVDAALCEATWWEAVAVLRELHAGGHLAFRPLRHVDGQPRRQLVAHHRRRSSPTYDEVVGEAFHGGEHVGWLTVDGLVVPDGSLLEPAGRPS
jgi:hypothetical protein